MTLSRLSPIWRAFFETFFGILINIKSSKQQRPIPKLKRIHLKKMNGNDQGKRKRQVDGENDSNKRVRRENSSYIAPVQADDEPVST